MKVTVVTLYHGRMIEHYVGVVLGDVTDEQKRMLAERFSAELDDDDNDGEDDERNVLHFADVEAVKDPSKITDLLNIDGIGWSSSAG